MALTRSQSIDQITVLEDGVILCREKTSIMDDDTQIAEAYHRTSFTPGDSLINVAANVAAICALVWTPEVVAAYRAKLHAMRGE